MARKFICGAGCGVATAGVQSAGTEHWDSITGTPTVVTSGPSPMRGTRCFRFLTTPSAVTLNHTYATAIASPATVTGRFYIYFVTLPVGDVSIASDNSVGGLSCAVRFVSSDNSLRARAGSVNGSSGVVVTTGQWYRVDFKWVHAATHTADIQVDGSAGAQATTASSNGTSTLLTIGAQAIVTAEFYMADIVIDDANVYPIGDSKVWAAYPNADGTHNFSTTGDFADSSPANIATGATNTYTFLASGALPATVATAFNGWVTAVAPATSEYLRWRFENLPAEALTVKCVAAVSTHHSVSATANAHDLLIVDDSATSGTTVAVELAHLGGWAAGVFTTGVDLSDTELTIKYSAPRETGVTTGAWTLANVNDLAAIFGGTDVNPDAHCSGVCLEIEYTYSSLADLSRTATDTLLGSDTAVKSVQVFARTASDTLLGTDTATKVLTKPRTAADALLGSDTATRTIGAPYGLVLDGTSGTYADTPDAAAFSPFSGLLRLAVRVAAADYTPALRRVLISQSTGTGNQRAWYFTTEAGATPSLGLATCTDGVSLTLQATTGAIPLVDGQTYWLGVEHNTATGAAAFYWAADSPEPPTFWSGWQSIAKGADAPSGTLFDTSTPVIIGARDGGTTDRFVGTVYRALVLNSSTVLTDADFSDTGSPLAVAHTTSYTDEYNKTWTLHGTAVIADRGFVRTATDTLVGGDTATRSTLVRTRTATDTLLGGDTAVGQKGVSRTTTDVLLGSDTATRAALARIRTAADALISTDISTRLYIAAHATVDVLLGSDSAVRSAFVRTRTTTDVLLGSDSAVRSARSLTRASTDVLLGSDAAVRSLTEPRAIIDALLGADTATRSSTRSRTAADGLLGTDTATRLRVLPRTAGDVLLGSDTAVGQFTPGSASYNRTATDVLLGTDTATQLRALPRTTADTLLGSDTATRVRALPRTTADTLLDTDTAIRVVARPRTTADVLLGGDTSVRGLVQNRTAADVLLGTDAATRAAFGRARSTTDTLLGGDTASRAALARSRSSTDLLLGSDTALGVVGAALFGTDLLLGSDSASRAALTRQRSASDVLLGADGAGRASVQARAAADGLLGSDTLVAFGAKVRFATDTLLGGDIADRANLARSRPVVDTLLGADTSRPLLVFVRISGDVLLGTDTAAGVFAEFEPDQPSTGPLSIVIFPSATSVVLLPSGLSVVIASGATTVTLIPQPEVATLDDSGKTALTLAGSTTSVGI